MSRQLLEHMPRFDPGTAHTLVRNHYGIDASTNVLPGERDQNFLIESESGEKFVLKIANALEERDFFEAQDRVLAYLESRINYCPQVVPTLPGERIVEIQKGSSRNLVRLVRYLPGIPLAHANQSPGLLRDLGTKLARLDHSLLHIDEPAFHRNFHWDLANGELVIQQHLGLVRDVRVRRLVEVLLKRFERCVSPLLPKLQRSLIHGDANDYNVLVNDDAKSPEVVGLIDFGDMVWSFTVGELAVAMAYVMLDKKDPVAVAANVVEGYAAEYPLDESEVEALFGLAVMRLGMSVCLAAHQQQQRPDNEYLEISQRAIRGTLPMLVESDWSAATETFRN